jgi:GT2 family glycosyltransferase
MDATIYVADNASTDDSLHFIASTFPQVKILKNSENGGYAKGYNDALKDLDADVFCLLNNDIEVTHNWLVPILKEFQTNAQTAIIQPKILDFKNKSFFEYAGAAGGFIDTYGYPYCRGRLFNTIEKDTNQYLDSNIFWASGACLFIRAETFNQLNGFDASFFAHMEEIDLCWRAFNLNYKVKYIGDSVVYHVGGATLENTNPKKTYLNFRNSLYTLTKNAHGNIFSLIFTRLILDGLAGLKFLVELKLQHSFAILKAHFSFYKRLPKLLQQRKSLEQSANYAHKRSIVWAYYIAKKRRFNSL